MAETKFTAAAARAKFIAAVAKDGKELVAAKLQCSVGQVINLSETDAIPGLRIACAIEETYDIDMKEWLQLPAARKVA